jgi:hypothetical protein
LEDNYGEIGVLYYSSNTIKGVFNGHKEFFFDFDVSSSDLNYDKEHNKGVLYLFNTIRGVFIFNVHNGFFFSPSSYRSILLTYDYDR